MANRYWVGGSGNWDLSDTTHWAASSGGAGGASVPTSADNVFFDSSSNATAYTVTVTQAVLCADLDMGAPASGKITFIHSGSVSLDIYGSLNLSGGTAGITWSFISLITFRSTSTGKTITNNGIVYASNSITFNGVGGGWTLQDTLTLSVGTLRMTNGTFNTNGQAVNAGSTTAGGLTSSVGTSVLTLGASVLTIKNVCSLDNLGTLNAGTSTIDFTSNNGLFFRGGGHTFYSVTIASILNITLTGNNTFTNLTFTGRSATFHNFLIGGNQTITGTLTINGNSTVNRLLISSDVTGTGRTLTAASVSVTYADFMDITGAGASSWDLSAITGLSGDCGGNSGITFTTSTTQHWTNTAGGTWGVASNWTSRIPLPQDDVLMDAAFGISTTVTANMPRAGRSIDWSGATWTISLTFTGTVAHGVFGSLTLISGLTFAGSILIKFFGRGSYTFNPAGITMPQQISVDVGNGTLTLAGDLTFSGTRELIINSGTFSVSASNYAITAGSLWVRVAGIINLGSATHTFSNTSTCVDIDVAATVNAGTSTIKLTNTSSSSVTFKGSDKTYYNLWFARGASTALCIITGANTFNDIQDTGTAAHTIRFPNSTTTVTTFSVSGSSGNLITLQRTGSSGTWTIAKAGGGIVSVDYLSISNSAATPATTWYAGDNSTDGGSNSGWIFTSPPTFSRVPSMFNVF